MQLEEQVEQAAAKEAQEGDDEAPETPVSPTKGADKDKVTQRLMNVMRKVRNKLVALKWAGTVKVKAQVLGIGLFVGMGISREMIEIAEKEAANGAEIEDEDSEKYKKDKAANKIFRYLDKGLQRVKKVALAMKVHS